MNEQNKIITYQEVLQRFHDEFEDKSIETTLIQAPSPENGMVAISKAVVKGTKNGQLYHFEGIGDASEANVGRTIKPHITRQSETRAKARALKDCVNAKGTLPDEPDHQAAEEAPPPAPPEEMRGAAKNAKPKMAKRPLTMRGPGEPQEKRITKSQLEILRAMATELRGEDGPARLEARIGMPLEDLTFDEGDDWIRHLSPDGEPVESGSV